MRSLSRFRLGVLFVFTLAARICAQEEPFLLSASSGAAIEFSLGGTGWRLSRLFTPAGPSDGWTLAEEGIEIATAEHEGVLNRGWTLVENAADKVVLEQAGAGTGLRLRRIFSFGPSTNSLRMETWVQSSEGKRLLTRLGLLDVRVDGETFHETGAAPMSFPAFGTALFVGIEHVSGECAVMGEISDQVRLMHRPRVEVADDWQRLANVVIGWTQPGVGTGLTGDNGVREAFLHYLDAVRIKPDRIVLHTDTWWTVPLPLSEKNVLNDIEILRKAFQERTGMFFDTYCVDLGWSNPRTLWRMETERFPNELRLINDRLGSLGAKMGLWLSPGSGYPEGLSNSWLQSQGYEVTPFPGSLGQVPCFALGTRYQREFKERVVAYAQQYGLGHVILDFMAQRCDVPGHGHPVGPESRYAIDAGLADVLDGLRAVNPQMALEPMVCGYPPSPWWLTKTPFVLGPAGDDLPYGRGPSPDWLESLITARDVAYRAGQEAWIMPTQALETFDIIVLSPGDFQNMAVMAVGRGRWFLSTYFKADMMSPEDWDFFAALVRWARENKQHLVNAWQFGGQPENREAYGFMFRNSARDLYCVRNPWMEERVIELPAPTSAEAQDVRMIYPRRATVGRSEAGARTLRVTLAPYETMFLETVPAGEAAAPQGGSIAPVAAMNGPAPRLLAPAAASSGQEANGFRYYWDGVLAVPQVLEPELCVLVEGPAEVERSSCKILIGGREAKVRKVTSAGQFGAAIDRSPENWTWFIATLEPGETSLQIEVSVQLDHASIGAFVRGFTPVDNDPAPESGAVFPTFHPDRRAWSQTMLPLAEFTSAAR